MKTDPLRIMAADGVKVTSGEVPDVGPLLVVKASDRLNADSVELYLDPVAALHVGAQLQRFAQEIIGTLGPQEPGE